MFDDAMVVQSAISAFNNAALFAPAFLFWGLLMLPLFGMVYFYGADFLARFGWNAKNMISRTCMTTVVMILMWVVMFGGNYGVLRDSATVLPFMVAATVFVSSMFIASRMRNNNILNAWRGVRRGGRAGMIAVVCAILIMVGLSDTHAWWGPILQIGALVCGWLFGRVARGEMRDVAGCVLIIMATSTAILMQPEFFRFGQLGALTVFHLVALVLVGAAAAATVALRNVAPHGRIHQSAYVKLKWMARFLSALCAVLFVLTESVPVFLAMSIMFFVSFAMSVWHAKILPAALGDMAFAALLMMFGLITVMPVIGALGLVLYQQSARSCSVRDGRVLL